MAMPRKRAGNKAQPEKRGKGAEINDLSLFPVSLSSSRRTSVSIIGAGRLGVALALALRARGYKIEAVVARRPGHARRASELIGAQVRALIPAQLDQLPPTSIIFITTPDDAIEPTARELAAKIEWSGRGRIALHASGALSSEALSSLRAAGFRTGSMHPLISVSDSLTGAESLAQAYYCIEGEPPAARVARSLVRAIGGRSFSINTQDKALYHAAAVMSSGHAVALFDIATEMLKGCGLSGRQARAALLPLMRSTLENLSQHAPARALTGTFARADVATVLKHLAALSSSNSRDALAAYTLLGQRSLELARKNGADDDALTRIKHALAEAAKNQKR
jgi:predicted short-subunit dehydrogenase-like oxidoreductase (DUF2520 family)